LNVRTGNRKTSGIIDFRILFGALTVASIERRIKATEENSGKKKILGSTQNF